ncbi:MAG: glycoside hydrolase family 2 TIM barrel-domain containing protein [Ferruginibacter sp.]
MKPATVFFIFFLAVHLVMAQQYCPINVYGRKTISLNGRWNYIVDPYETGYYNFHGLQYDKYDQGSNAAFYNNYHAKDKQELVEYDFDRSAVMKIPADWNTSDPKLLYYEGTVWFKKSFDYNLPAGRRLFVYFGAVNYQAEVYLNGSKLGVHTGGFTGFGFEITKLLKQEGNYLVVKVDNRRLKQGVPTINTDWWNYGGITRDVLLVDEPATFIEDYTLQFSKKTANSITGFVQLNNAKAGQEISIHIPALKLQKTIVADGAGRAYFETAAGTGLKLWSPENPQLYEVSISIPGQQIKDKVGFRTIETRDAGILLNGEKIFLKGICLHEEINGRRANSEKDAETLLRYAKNLGCNYVRLAHYPHNEYMLKKADELGLMVWEEIPVYWTVDFSNTETYKNAENQLLEMINRDKNRASVIIWSVANETPASAARNEFLKSLVHKTRLFDSSRLVSAALLTRNENGISIIDDEMGEWLDIISINQYRGWYGGDLATAPEAKWQSVFNKPLLVSEFGGDAKQGLHGNKEERWTEEYQEYLYRQNLLMIEKMPNISGLSPWILMDFRSPRRNLPGVQDGFNRKGLVSDKGKKKKAFFVLEQHYKTKK